MNSIGSSSTRSQQSKVTSVFSDPLESRLDLKDLRALMDVFKPPKTAPKSGRSSQQRSSQKDALQRLSSKYFDERDQTSKKLTRSEFGEKLSKAVKKGSKDEYSELFDKVDITNEGAVDWEMLVQFMLLEFYEEDEKVKTTQVPQWKDLKVVASPHKDTIQRVDMVRATNKYVTVSKEGCVVLWDQHLKLQRDIKITTDSVKPRDLWVTDFVLLPNINKIAISFTSKEVCFYDLSSKLDFNCQYKLQGLDSTPLSMDFWSNPDDPNESILVFGDVGGQVHALCFASAQIALFDRPTQGADGKQPDTNTTVCVRMKDLLRDNSKHTNCRVVFHSAHTGWVRQVKYAEHLECFISCSTGNHNTVVVGFIEKASTAMRTTSFRYNHGVHCFDYHQKMNLIATGGVSNEVCLWNPYVISKPVGILTGHMAAVIQVIVNANKSHLMSFSKDKVLRIWDIQQQVCLQRLAGMFPKGPEVQTRLYFDEIKNRLFVSFNYQLTMLEMKVEVTDRTMSHDRPVTCALYNSLYNQVISACQSGTVTVWMIDNGQKVKQFTNCHGNSEITTIELDHSRTRLFTGSADGTIKVWDFNGHCHHSLNVGGGKPADIAQVVMLKRSIIAVGWDKLVTVFRQGALTQFLVEPADWKGGKEHADDILTSAYSPPSMLATGSYDGEIVIWNTTSECSHKKLQQRSRQRLGKRPMTSASLLVVDDSSSIRPMTSESQASELELSFVISRLLFLKHRTATHVGQSGADLVSCGGGGWVRFWGTGKSRLLGEFVAHPHAGNVIATVDAEDKFLVTADSDGAMKSWDIEHHLVEEPADTVTSPPPMIAAWQAHSDCINSLCVCERNGQLLMITASSDCSVALWSLRGQRVGEFGQDSHWRLDLVGEDEVKGRDPEDDPKQEEGLFKEFDIGDLELESRASTAPTVPTAPDSAPGFDREFRAETWKSTVLGRSYREGRGAKRERKQPGTIHGYKKYAEESAVGPYGVLPYSDVEATTPLRKPDFVLRPHLYFGEKRGRSKRREEEEEGASPTLVEKRLTLKAAFDERTLFPKELLDFEAQIRTEHQQKLKTSWQRKSKPLSILKSFQASSGNMSSSAQTKVSSRVGSSRQTGFMKHKSSQQILATSEATIG